ncbi:MAG: flavodoxin family protein [Acetobacterium woodii]|nr:flavodoxin family protein [Acetobacterium woodii]
MITILSDHTKQKVGETLYESLKNKDILTEFISVEEINVGPCYSCGGCTDKTYGKCINRDDADMIFPKLIHTDVMVMITPVKWGSYSFKTKRVFDKCAVIGDRHYYKKNGELVKGKIGNINTFVAVGVKANWLDGEKEVFQNLVAENIKIMNIKGSAYVVDDKNWEVCLEAIIEELS